MCGGGRRREKPQNYFLRKYVIIRLCASTSTKSQIYSLDSAFALFYRFLLHICIRASTCIYHSSCHHTTLHIDIIISIIISTSLPFHFYITSRRISCGMCPTTNEIQNKIYKTQLLKHSVRVSCHNILLKLNSVKLNSATTNCLLALAWSLHNDASYKYINKGTLSLLQAGWHAW